MIEVGREFEKNGENMIVRVVRVLDHNGTRKVWYRRSDDRPITYDVVETWEYEDDFGRKFTALEGRG